MRDDDGRSALHVQEAVEGRLHQPLALHVQRRGGLVQQEDGGVLMRQMKGINKNESKRTRREESNRETNKDEETTFMRSRRGGGTMTDSSFGRGEDKHP